MAKQQTSIKEFVERLNGQSLRLAGVADVLNMCIEGKDQGDAVGLMSDVVVEINVAISDVATDLAQMELKLKRRGAALVVATA